MNFCPNCGQALENNFCKNCGVMQNPNNINGMYYNTNMQNQQTQYMPNQQVPEKKGIAIASMVLGIIATMWSLLDLLSFGAIEASINELLLEAGLYREAAIVGFAFGFVLFALIPGIIGLILGIAAKKNPMGKAGIILSSFALTVSIISIIYILTFI